MLQRIPQGHTVEMEVAFHDSRSADISFLFDGHPLSDEPAFTGLAGPLYPFACFSGLNGVAKDVQIFRAANLLVAIAAYTARDELHVACSMAMSGEVLVERAFPNSRPSFAEIKDILAG